MFDGYDWDAGEDCFEGGFGGEEFGGPEGVAAFELYLRHSVNVL